MDRISCECSLKIECVFESEHNMMLVEEKARSPLRDRNE